MLAEAAVERHTRSGPFYARILGGMGLAWIVAVMYAACAVFVPFLILPKFEEIFRDFGVALPWITTTLLGFSHWYSGGSQGQTIPGAILLIPLHLFVSIVCVSCGLLSMSGRAPLRWPARFTLLMVFVGLLAFLAASVLAVFVPLTAMISSLEGGAV